MALLALKMQRERVLVWYDIAFTLIFEDRKRNGKWQEFYTAYTCNSPSLEINNSVGHTISETPII